MMRAIKQFSLTMVVGLLTLGLVCSGAMAAEVVIGLTAPLSGPGAGYGSDCANGLKLAVDDINKAGGITVKGKKYTLKLEALDDQIDPTAAVNNARRLRTRSGARIIFNPVFNTIAPLMQINQQRGSEFLMMAYSSTPAIEQIENDLTISVPPPFTAYVQAFAEIAWEKGWRKGAMVVTLGAYGDEWRAAFKKHWVEKGGQMLADQPANYYTETDFSAPLSAALANQPDFLLIGGPSEPTGLVIEQAKNLGFKGGFLLVDQAKMDYIAEVVFKGDLAKMDNVIGVARVLDIPSPLIESFDKRSRETFGRITTWEVLLHYSVLRLMASAMEAAGSVDDPAAIKAAVPKVLPQSMDDVPTPYLGTLGRKVLLAPTVSIIENGAYRPPVQYVFWAKDEAAFAKAREIMPEGVETRWLPLEGYLQQ
jgi:branched-chain amino acid transport system substrate-binding protein